MDHQRLPYHPAITALRPEIGGVLVLIHDFQNLPIECEYALHGAHGMGGWCRSAVDSGGRTRIPLAPGQTVSVRASVVDEDGLRSRWAGPVTHTYERGPALPARTSLVERVEHFRSVLGQVEYPGLELRVSTSGEAIYLQVQAQDVCNVSGDPMTWRSGKWLLSEHMLDEEVVQKALKAVLTALEHEAREKFLYRGRAIFGPHYNLDMLWDVCGQPGSQVQRQPAPGAASPVKDPGDGYVGLSKGVPIYPDRNFARGLNLGDLRTLEEQMAARARDMLAEDPAEHLSFRHVTEEIVARGRRPLFDDEGVPINRMVFS